MKKMRFPLFSFILMLSMILPIHSKAAELPLITSGHTENGIYYEIHGESLHPDATTAPVTRYVTFQGKVIPPGQMSWEETVDGIRYSGTLQLSSYFYIKKDNTTSATYKGILNYYLNQ